MNVANTPNTNNSFNYLVSRGIIKQENLPNSDCKVNYRGNARHVFSIETKTITKSCVVSSFLLTTALLNRFVYIANPVTGLIVSATIAISGGLISSGILQLIGIHNGILNENDPVDNTNYTLAIGIKESETQTNPSNTHDK